MMAPKEQRLDEFNDEVRKQPIVLTSCDVV